MKRREGEQVKKKKRRRRSKHAASLPNYKAITWTGHRLKVKFMRCNKHQPLCVRRTFVLAWLLVTLDLSKKCLPLSSLSSSGPLSPSLSLSFMVMDTLQVTLTSVSPAKE